MARIDDGISHGRTLSCSTGMADGLEGKPQNPKSRPDGHGADYDKGYIEGGKLKRCSLLSNEVFEGMCEELRKDRRGERPPSNDLEGMLSELRVSFPVDQEIQHLFGRMIGIYFRDQIDKSQRS